MKRIYLSIIIAAALSGSVSWAVTDNTDTQLFKESKEAEQALKKIIQTPVDNTDIVTKVNLDLNLIDSTFPMVPIEGLKYQKSKNEITEAEQEKYSQNLKAITAEALSSPQYKETLEKGFKNYNADHLKQSYPYSFFIEEEKKETARVNEIIQQINNKRYTMNLYKIETDTKKDTKNLQFQTYVKIDDKLLNSESSVNKTLSTYGNVSLVNALGFNQNLLGQIGFSRFVQPFENNRIVEITYQYQFIMDRGIPYMELDGRNESEVLIKFSSKVRLDDYKNHIVNITQVGTTSYLLVLEEQ